MAKKRVKSLFGDNGVKIVPLNFAPQKGKIIKDIINGKGEVYKPNPYDIPNDPQRILAFVGHFIIAMMDVDKLCWGKTGHFITRKEWLLYRELTYEMLAGLNTLISKKKSPV